MAVILGALLTSYVGALGVIACVITAVAIMHLRGAR